MAPSKPTLVYFKAAGRVTGARMALFNAYGKDGWDNVMLTFDEFGAEKKKHAAGEADCALKTPMGYLPQLEMPEGKVITQTPCIARWAAKQGANPLYPSDPMDQLLTEEIIDVAQEILARSPSDPDTEVKLQKRKEYSEGFMKQAMTYLESKFAANASTSFFIRGSTYGLADCYVLMVTSMVASGEFDGIPPEYLDNFPLVKAHREKCLAEVELVKNYVAEGYMM
ncbi:unnamed protein product [Amoebophrya sp. A25]|nr:unnamed protein product [Amoebophrya sp. A25]|eukprot:GSA25T00011952001.1